MTTHHNHNSNFERALAQARVQLAEQDAQINELYELAGEPRPAKNAKPEPLPDELAAVFPELLELAPELGVVPMKPATGRRRVVNKSDTSNATPRPSSPIPFMRA